MRFSLAQLEATGVRGVTLRAARVVMGNAAVGSGLISSASRPSPAANSSSSSFVSLLRVPARHADVSLHQLRRWNNHLPVALRSSCPAPAFEEPPEELRFNSDVSSAAAGRGRLLLAPLDVCCLCG